MEVVTKVSLIDGLADTWKRLHYSSAESWNRPGSIIGWKTRIVTREGKRVHESAQVAYDELQSLERITEEDVERIIGNKNLIALYCHNCWNDVNLIVRFDLSEYTTDLCLDCLTEAVKIAGAG